MTNIEWTNETWNPLVGCTKVSAGCKHCYAETMGKRLRAMALADIAAGKNPGRKRAYIDAVDERGRWTGKVVTLPEALSEPLTWRKPRRVFVNSMSDLFHPTVPFEFIAAVFGVMAACPHHTFQVLTKQPGRAVEFFRWAAGNNHSHPETICLHYSRAYTAAPASSVYRWPLPNVWLGVSVEDQAAADERIPKLLDCPGAVRFVSYEPALGPVDFARVGAAGRGHDIDAIRGRRTRYGYKPVNGSEGATDVVNEPHARLDWIIVGGESGPGARPFHPEWALSVVRQCREAGVACFVKQVGSAPVLSEDEPPFRDKKGGDPAEWPDELRVREFPGCGTGG